MTKLKIPVIYGQQDPAWAAVLLGYNANVYTIGLYGCLLTCLAMYLTALGRTETPDSLNQKLKDNKGFVAGGGDYIWESLLKIYPDISLKFRSIRYPDVPAPDSVFTKMKSYLDSGYPCIIEIDNSPAPGEQMHFVLCYGYDDTNFFIADPWSGTKTVLSIYGAVAAVTIGFSVYSQPLPVEKPGTFVPQDDFERTVRKSGFFDSVVSLILGTDKDPNQTSFDDVQKSYSGVKGLITAAQNEAGQWKAEALGKDKQISSLEGQVLSANRSLDTLQKAHKIVLDERDTRIRELEEKDRTLVEENTKLLRQLAATPNALPPSWRMKMKIFLTNLVSQVKKNNSF